MPDVSGFEFRWEQVIFSSQSPTKSALGPIRNPVKWARQLILDVKRSVRAVDRLPLTPRFREGKPILLLRLCAFVASL